jgi:hypothetical protein
MFDDLRKSALESYEKDKEPEEAPVIEEEHEEARKESTFLGLSAPQRFIISLFILLMTCLLGGFCLILTEKVVVPFF